jgi:hypothetical protein
LVELLIVVTITPLIIGALSLGLMSMFSLQTSVTNRLGDSGDAQVVTASFIKDVQSATQVTTSSTASQCGPGTQLLGLTWGGGQDIVSYNDVPQSGSTYSLVREYCTSGASTSPTLSSVVSYDVLAPCNPVANCTVAPCTASTCQAPPVIYSGSTVVNASSGYVTAQGITRVDFAILEGKSKYTFTLNATPAAGLSTALGSLGGPSNGPTCGFALPGTGTYASTLCFVGFTNQIISSAETSTCADGATGTDVSAAVPGGYTMSFCLTVALGNSSDVIQAAAFPTWTGAFLGNDILGVPFYTGVGCPDSDPTTESGQGTPSCINPAIYQISSGDTDVVTASNILVTAPGGGDATNYEVVAADAETTDPGESIIWNSTLPAASPFNFQQVPDTSTSPEGDACNETTLSDAQGGELVDNGTGLTGVGTNQVECVSTWQSGAGYPRTGTVLLEVSPTTTAGVTAPVTISATIHGTGLEGVAFGLLLP